MDTPKALDVLAFGAHPDDAELAAGGTLRLCVLQGHAAGIVDLTRGELGSRGTSRIRAEEARAAGEVLGLAVRENLGMADGAITDQGRTAIIRALRTWRPRIVLTHPPECRHPDHVQTAKLVVEACFYSGLRKLVTEDANGQTQQPWRPRHVLHFAEVMPFEPTLVVDVTSTWADRTRALQCYASQVHHPDYVPKMDEPETFISNPDFFAWIEARARMWGYRIGARYGEPFAYRGVMGTSDLMSALSLDARFR